MLDLAALGVAYVFRRESHVTQVQDSGGDSQHALHLLVGHANVAHRLQRHLELGRVALALHRVALAAGQISVRLGIFLQLQGLAVLASQQLVEYVEVPLPRPRLDDPIYVYVCVCIY